jgi:hypothetical protein
MKTVNPMIYYLDGRLFEWAMTTGKITLGFQFALIPDTIKSVPFQWISEVNGAMLLATVMLSTGFIRLGALIANGASLVIGPYLRSLTAMFGAVLWFEFGVSYLVGAIQRGFGGPLSFWFVFSLAELYVVYRAVLDVRNYR